MDKIDHQILTPLATLLCLVISGCDELGQQIGALTGEQDKQVQALIERTKAQMVFVEGGSFMMGDGGGPNNLPWTIARDNKPAHKVTLTSYSMGAYEVSYGDFDLYTAVKSTMPVTSFFWVNTNIVSVMGVKCFKNDVGHFSHRQSGWLCRIFYV
ncbi:MULTISPECIES: SUMF1/EgtB/PvdO family nonheme iron enzyme [unclassified Pseudoalteromonas]|uniref:SUMF1/EgtB/PvdO family nonheme iron enzyme n=1 Tax=unclassified Pseudoalteromonas TaxID=194690 RepID=UPI001F2B34F6|nr:MULTISPECIES: SUMF1/EgtB/PvdO family nonheme iron enzyme [unclassified Pseudoalteromonas]MCF2826247.1 SUMF1/EgtB/PvdO family nonheme iron enzyme [Pseudoalteromonas sp. OF5H-5]MCF2830241.1 SUMF1/EgtB/PvdO family nonheme iron enzyme [Pseudoalteromonas sp. DL2-H6]MCF2925485.1 SUMF1/EgtB/PvdO family nonheme iron enzyme [Pseudoalteromonas sp. DL2-H1]